MLQIGFSDILQDVRPGSQRLVLVGDQCQLPPTVQSTEECSEPVGCRSDDVTWLSRKLGSSVRHIIFALDCEKGQETAIYRHLMAFRCSQSPVLTPNLDPNDCPKSSHGRQRSEDYPCRCTRVTGRGITSR